MPDSPPIALAEPRAEVEPAAPAILLVNDEPAQLLAMEATLAATGCRMVRASSGREALRHMLTDEFAVVVLDVRMPDMDGFETARFIRQRPRSESTPIIFATAEAVDPEDRQRGYSLGAVDYLVAPFDGFALRSKVNVFLEIFEQARAIRQQAESLRELNLQLVRAAELVANSSRALDNEVQERRRAEEQLIEQASQFAAGIAELESYDYSVAHDLRAPLRAIIGFSTILAEDHASEISEESKHNLERIISNARRMAELIEGILVLARARRTEVRRSPVDLSAIALESLERLTTAHPERGVIVNVQPGLSAFADPVLVSVVMQNLLENAWKFTRTREVARIDVGSQPGDGTPVFFVRDNGVGFDAALAGDLFRPFRRLHGQEQFEGTGVGLATVRRIVERHGGLVWVNGELDRGVTVYFTLAGAEDPVDQGLVEACEGTPIEGSLGSQCLRSVPGENQMDKSQLIDQLNNLIQLDIDAIRAYSQALGSIEDPEVSRQLTAFRGDHERHVTDLAALVRAAGGEPANAPDLKGFFIEGMTAIRAMAGEKAALRAMRDNERLTNRRYEAALQLTGLPDDARGVIAANREDERRHLAWIEARVSRGAMA